MIKTKFSRAISAVMSRAKLIAVVLAAIVLVSTFPVQFIKAVSIEDGDKQFMVYSFGTDTKTILSSASIEVDEADEITVALEEKENCDLTIKIKRAFPITITVGEETRTMEVCSGTVADAINEFGFVTDRYDEITPSLETELYEGIEIEVVDINYITEVKTKTIKHKVKEIPTESLKPGKTKVIKEGKDGSKTITKTTKTVNGKTVSVKTKKETTEKAITEKVLVGTDMSIANSKDWISELKPKKNIKLDEDGKPIGYKKVLKGTASAYCTGTTCSTGVKVKPGYIAVDPKIIPYGTEMYIRTTDGKWIYGYAVAADTGGFTAWGNTIADLYMDSYSQAVNFGRRNIEIYMF